MKKIIFALMGLAMFSCESIDGKQSDTIKTSVDAVTLTDNKPSAVITTGGEMWFMNSFIEDGETYHIDNYVDSSVKPEEWDSTIKLPNGYTFSLGVVEGLTDNWSRDVTGISCDWVTITRTLQKITINATDTKIDAPKTIKVWLSDRNYGEQITITRE